jgi:threonine aldolase
MEAQLQRMREVLRARLVPRYVDGARFAVAMDREREGLLATSE